MFLRFLLRQVWSTVATLSAPFSGRLVFGLKVLGGRVRNPISRLFSSGSGNSDSGQPIASLLAAEYGIPFILCFVVSPRAEGWGRLWFLEQCFCCSFMNMFNMFKLDCYAVSGCSLNSQFGEDSLHSRKKIYEPGERHTKVPHWKAQRPLGTLKATLAHCKVSNNIKDCFEPFGIGVRV